MPLAPSNSAQHKYRSMGGGWRAAGTNFPATLTTALSGTHNDLVYTAVAPGTAGNAITVRYVVAGNSTPLTVSVTGSAITVNVATNGGGAPTSTAAQVAAAVAASAPAAALVGTPANAASNDGSGVVAALSVTNLAGGTDWVISNK